MPKNNKTILLRLDPMLHKALQEVVEAVNKSGSLGRASMNSVITSLIVIGMKSMNILNENKKEKEGIN